MWLIDRLFNRKIEGKSSLDKLEPLTEVADELLEIGKNGADRVQPSALVGLTHSFNELDPVLKQIVEDAIADNFTDGVACSSEQWGAIKRLLDSSLYINYQGFSLIKALTDGIKEYIFGTERYSDFGLILHFYYNPESEMLNATYAET